MSGRERNKGWKKRTNKKVKKKSTLNRLLDLDI